SAPKKCSRHLKLLARSHCGQGNELRLFSAIDRVCRCPLLCPGSAQDVGHGEIALVTGVFEDLSARLSTEWKGDLPGFRVDVWVFDGDFVLNRILRGAREVFDHTQ